MGLFSKVTDTLGITDSGAAEKAMKKAGGAQKAILARLDKIDLPDIEKQRILLENPELVGLLESEQLSDSQLNEIMLDPRLRDNQMKALESLSQRSEEGLTSEDKYLMEQMLGDVAAQESSQQAAIEADMARRGMDSSGFAERSKREATQSAANQAREKAMQMAAQSRQQRMAALQALGQQSGQMESQDFSRQAQVGSAQDAIARANAMNRQQVAAQNLAARQSIENQRANLSNQQQMYNKGLLQQQFQNEMQKAGAQNVAQGNLANMYSQQGQAKAAADSAMTQSLFKTGASFFMPAEDGGIARAADGGVMSRHEGGVPVDMKALEAEQKQKAKFKKDYMKQIHNELLEGGVPTKPQAADGGIMESVTDPSELPERGGTDFASPDDRKSAIYAALLAEMANMNPEQNIPMDREIPQIPMMADGGTPMYASDGMGDVIDSGEESYAGDRVDAKVNDGEMILNLPQQQRLLDLIRGEIGVDELGSDDIIEGVPRDYRDDLHEEKEIESDDKMAALMKVIEMMGDK